MKLLLENKFRDIFATLGNTLGEENLYLVGGFVRDMLSFRESTDMDFACTLSPDVIYSNFPSSLYFERYGTISFKMDDVHITIASMRKDGQYLDSRHPTKVEFVSSIEEEYKRRDFTINCLYVNSSFEVIDPTGLGLKDIQDKKIRLIGGKKRLIEDPLRILRAYRFAYELNFEIEEKTYQYILKTKEEISKLNPDKIREELRKVDEKTKDKMIKELSLSTYLDI